MYDCVQLRFSVKYACIGVIKQHFSVLGSREQDLSKLGPYRVTAFCATWGIDEGD